MRVLRSFLPIFALIYLSLLTGCFGESNEEKALREQNAINEVIAKANETIEKGRAMDAVDLLEELQASYPDHAEILEAIAFSYAAVPDPTFAAYYFEQAWRLDPMNPDYLLYAAQAYEKADDVASAIQNYERYLDEDPDDASIRRTLIALQAELGNYEAALESSQALEVPGPNDLLLRASLHIQIADLEAAKAIYNELLEADAQNLDAAIGLINLDAQQKNWEAVGPALLDLEGKELASVQKQALAQTKEDFTQWHEEQLALTKAQEAQNEEPSAESDVEVAEQTEAPESKEEEAPKSNEELAAAATQEGDYKTAITYYWKALLDQENNPGLWYQLSQSYFELGDMRNSSMAALEAKRRNPHDLQYELAYLKALQYEANPKDFYQALSKARKEYPRSSDITLALARATWRIEGKRRSAIFLYEQFLKMAPDHPKYMEAEVELAELEAKAATANN